MNILDGKQQLNDFTTEIVNINLVHIYYQKLISTVSFGFLLTSILIIVFLY